MNNIILVGFIAFLALPNQAQSVSCSDVLAEQSQNTRFADRLKMPLPGDQSKKTYGEPTTEMKTLRINPVNSKKWTLGAGESGLDRAKSFLTSWIPGVSSSVNVAKVDMVKRSEAVSFKGAFKSKSEFYNVSFDTELVSPYPVANTIEFQMQKKDSNKTSLVVEVENPLTPGQFYSLELEIDNEKVIPRSNGLVSVALGWKDFKLNGQPLPQELVSLGALKIKSMGFRFYADIDVELTELDFSVNGPISFSTNLIDLMAARKQRVSEVEGEKELLDGFDILRQFKEIPGGSIDTMLAEAFNRLDPGYTVTYYKWIGLERSHTSVEVGHEEAVKFLRGLKYPYDKFERGAFLEHHLVERLSELQTNNPLDDLRAQEHTANTLIKRLYDREIQDHYLVLLKEKGVEEIVDRVQNLGFDIAVQPENQSIRKIWSHSLKGFFPNMGRHSINERDEDQKIILYDPESIEHGPASHLLQTLALYHDATPAEIKYLDKLFLGLRSNETRFRYIWHFLFDGTGTVHANSPDYWQLRAEEMGVTLTVEDYMGFAETLK